MSFAKAICDVFSVKASIGQLWQTACYKVILYLLPFNQVIFILFLLKRASNSEAVQHFCNLDETV